MIIHIQKIYPLVKGIESTGILSFFYLLLGNRIVLFFTILDLLHSAPKCPVLLVLDDCSGVLRVL